MNNTAWQSWLEIRNRTLELIQLCYGRQLPSLCQHPPVLPEASLLADLASTNRCVAPRPVLWLMCYQTPNLR